VIIKQLNVFTVACQSHQHALCPEVHGCRATILKELIAPGKLVLL